MGALIVSLLWLLIYVIIFCGVVWLVIYGIKTFVYKDFPPKLEQGIWFIVLILILIAFVTALTGSGSHLPAYRW